MPFSLPLVPHNPDGWGPPALLPKDAETIGDIPYAPFNKGERFGRVADWNQMGQNQRYQQQQQRGYYAQAGALFAGVMREEEETGFKSVENQNRGFQTRRPYSRPFNAGGMRGGRGGQQGRGAWGGRGMAGGRGGVVLGGRGMMGRGAKRPMNRQYVHRLASVEVRPTWKVVQQFAQADLAKLDANPPDAPTDLHVCGSLDTYDTTFDFRASTKTPFVLSDCSSKTFHSVTTTDDPIIRDIVMNDDGSTPEMKEHRVFATDGILAAIMSSTRSVNSWDVSVEVLDNDGAKIIFLDKRDEFDLLPVQETSTEPPNTPELATSLAEELALVNQRFSQQVLKKGVKKMELSGWEANPFVEGDEDVASALYKYRKWRLDKNVVLVARCQVDGVIKQEGKGGKTDFYKIFALNEYDPRVTDWRKKLDTSPGAVLATEIKNNACTLAKWAAKTILAGADIMKLGYVCRVKPENRLEHNVYLVQQYDPVLFARQNLAMNSRNMWAIVKTIVDACLKLGEGKYVLMKDPNKQLLHLYALPAEAAEEDEGPSLRQKESDNEQ